MAYSHYLCLTFSLFLAIAFTTNVKADLVDDICAGRTHPAICTQLLRSDPRSKTTDLTTLGFVAIDIATKQANSGQSIVQSLLKGATDPKLKQTYSSCLDSYGDALDNINELPAFLKSKDYGSIGAYASAALDAPGDCDDNFSSPEPSQLKDVSLKLETSCTIILAVSNKLQGH